MPDLWERMKKTVSEIYTTASGKAVEGVNLGVKKLDEVTIRRELTREFAGLGGRTYQLLKREEGEAVASDPTVQHHMTRLAELEKRLEEKEKEIREIRSADSRPQPAAPAAGSESGPGPALEGPESDPPRPEPQPPGPES